MDNDQLLEKMSKQDIEEVTKSRYSEVAENPFGVFNFPVGRAFALKVGYPKKELDSLPETICESFTGAGNPQSFVEIESGETVLDLGCGAGLDIYFYSKAVGPEGKVQGLDISEEMVKKARDNMEKIGLTTVEIKQGVSDNIPFNDGFFDIVASNGIYNLSPDKQAVMKEVFRVLKPGGRTVFSEIILEKPLPVEAKYIGDWFKCIGGALTEPELLALMKDIGFEKIEVISKGKNPRTSNKLSFCANIRAYKPMQ